MKKEKDKVDLAKQRIDVKPIKVKCPKPGCGHTQLSVIGIKKDSPNAVQYVDLCEHCGTQTVFLSHVLPVKRKRRSKKLEMIPPPLFDDNLKPITYE